MSEDNLIEWFWDLYNSCYPVTHSDYPDSIFLFFDEKFIRKIKLCKLSKINLPKKVVGVCLFEIDWKNYYFYYNFDKIYAFLRLNYSNDYLKIRDFIDDRLKEADKLNILTPYSKRVNAVLSLKEADKLNILTPQSLTSVIRLIHINFQLKADKLIILTPLIK